VRKALGYGLLFKMIRLCSDLSQLGKPVNEAVSKARTQGKSEELWPFVLPILPLPDPIKFSAEEMALVLSLDNKLFNDMAALDGVEDDHDAVAGIAFERAAVINDDLADGRMILGQQRHNIFWV
jgi:hypothetical protein